MRIEEKSGIRFRFSFSSSIILLFHLINITYSIFIFLLPTFDTQPFFELLFRNSILFANLNNTKRCSLFPRFMNQSIRLVFTNSEQFLYFCNCIYNFFHPYFSHCIFNNVFPQTSTSFIKINVSKNIFLLQTLSTFLFFLPY